MRVQVLDHPRIGSHDHFNDIASTPLWSCLLARSVAASLQEAGADVTYLDHCQPGDSFATVRRLILESAPDILAVNGVYFWEHTEELFGFLVQLREGGFFGHVNLFGFFPSLVYREILGEYSCVDSVAVGECEHTLVALWQGLREKRGVHAIAGLATRSPAGTIQYTARPVENEPDNFPFPLQPEAVDGPVMILASRGCYNRCSFCLVPTFDPLRGGWRGRSPENIAAEVGRYVEAGYSDFYFSDPNFIGPGREGRARILRLLELLHGLHITFGMETRANDLNDELMAALVGAGLASLLLGIESGSASLLGRINKHSSVASASKAISLCRKYGIDPEIGFLMFLPEAQPQDLHDNFQFLLDNGLLNRLDRTANLFCHRQIVLRGTAGYTGYRQEGRLLQHGIFGFVGLVPFGDPAIALLAETIIHACHRVLRLMSDQTSPIFWRNPHPDCCDLLNDYLVALFASSLADLGAGRNFCSKDVVDREILNIIKGFPLPPGVAAVR